MGSQVGSQITLGSSTGTELISLQEDLQWSPAQESTVNAVCKGIAQGTAVEAAQFDQCFTLLSDTFDGIEFSPVGQTIREAYRQASTPRVKLRIAGFMAEYPEFMRDLLKSDSATSEVLGEDGIARLYEIMNEVDDAQRVGDLFGFCRQHLGLVPQTFTGAHETAIHRQAQKTSVGSADPELTAILYDQDVDGMREMILEAGQRGDLGQLADRLARLSPEAVEPLLNTLLQDGQLAQEGNPQWVFDLMLQLPGERTPLQNPQGGPPGDGALADELHQMDRDALEQLLLSPISPNTLAQTYYPPAFCSHVMGLLVPD
jgi:hypothetical protein